jgi:3-methylcrotonyl-CoA carboxylase alpha subunit
VTRKILIANRGEIACRIARTVRARGESVATVHSSADADALHVREIGESVLIGDGPARQSYLNIEAVVAAALRVGADAVHPGFGFLSENPAFARRCAEAGLVFIGPSPDTLALFGDKAAAKRLARALDIPVAAGLDEPSDDLATLLAATAELPLPYILKAVAGGGGKGMRVVQARGEAQAAIEAAMREGRSAFGDGRLIAERYLRRPRHVEVQILGDGQGQVVHVFDRECSLQRRHQKVIEEAPVTSLPLALRERLWAHAVALGRHTRYRGLGTVEFAVVDGDAIFLEVNPRLQVEHPVTEAVTGLDLVSLQIDAVCEGRLPPGMETLAAPRGVAMQARLYAEDPLQGFMPSTGTVAVFQAPPSIRTDAGVASGSVISPHYDPMVAKLIAHGVDRPAALARLREALQQTTVLGVAHNRSFLLGLLDDPQVQANAVHTELIDAFLPVWQQGAAQAPGSAVLAGALALWLWQRRAAQAAQAGAWGDVDLACWRGQWPQQVVPTHGLSGPGGAWRVGFGPAETDGALRVRVDAHVHTVHAVAGGVEVDGWRLPLCVRSEAAQLELQWGAQQWLWDLTPLRERLRDGGGAAQGAVRAPMMGLVVTVDVQAGELVEAGARLATLESMKMEIAITAPCAGTVQSVACAPRDKVERHQDLFTIQP